MNNENILNLFLLVIGLYLAIRFKYIAQRAVREGKDTNDKLPKWVPWPFRLSDKAFNDNDIKGAQFVSLIGGILLILIGIKNLLS